jgi:hypothetical protein
MIKKLINKIRSIRIALLHARYHRNLKKAVYIQEHGNQDLVRFKKYIYRSEDAWRKMVTLTEKQK